MFQHVIIFELTAEGGDEEGEDHSRVQAPRLEHNLSSNLLQSLLSKLV